MSEENFCKKFLGALTCCLWQRLFDASVGDQVYRFTQDFLSEATSIESAEMGYRRVERLGSENYQRR